MSAASAPLTRLTTASLLSLGFGALYLVTMAPTVLWGDDAELQRIAATGAPPAGATRSYPAWQFIAALFVRVPLFDVAWRVTLVSVVFGAVTVALVFSIASYLVRTRHYAVVAAVAFGVSHTLWLHAVRAEVYTVFLTLFGMSVLLLVRHAVTSSPSLLVAGSLMASIALTGHLLAGALLPALAFLWWRARPWPVALSALLAYAVGLLPVSILTNSGGSIAQRAFVLLRDASLLGLKDAVLWMGFLGYQFLVLTPVGLAGAWWLTRRNRTLGCFTALLYASLVLVALGLRTPDRYVFFLPSYVVYAGWIAVGLERACQGVGTRAAVSCRWGLLAALAIIATATLYLAVPLTLNYLHLNPMGVRTIPYRDANVFFLFPPKTGNDGARQFAEATMMTAAPHAAILADWTPLQALLYLQEIERVRPDIVLQEALPGRGTQVPWLKLMSRTRPVYLADVGPYYDMVAIEACFSVVSDEPVYRLLPR